MPSSIIFWRISASAGSIFPWRRGAFAVLEDEVHDLVVGEEGVGQGEILAVKFAIGVAHEVLRCGCGEAL